MPPLKSAAVLGEWVPSPLADLLALQRAEEPETATALIGCSATAQAQELPHDNFDLALSTAAWEWPGWVCEPLWHDTLAVAVAKRSHLLSYREVPRQELLKQPLICAQSTADEPWRAGRMAWSRMHRRAMSRPSAPSTWR